MEDWLNCQISSLVKYPQNEKNKASYRYFKVLVFCPLLRFLHKKKQKETKCHKCPMWLCPLHSLFELTVSLGSVLIMILENNCVIGNQNILHPYFTFNYACNHS